MATFLDVNHRLSPFKPAAKDSVLKLVVTVIAGHELLKHGGAHETSGMHSTDGQQANDCNELQGLTKAKVQRAASRNQQRNSLHIDEIEAQCMRYLLMTKPPQGTDALKWMEDSDLDLLKLPALMFLPIQASSAPAERLFKAGSHVVPKKSRQKKKQSIEGSMILSSAPESYWKWRLQHYLGDQEADECINAIERESAVRNACYRSIS